MIRSWQAALVTGAFATGFTPSLLHARTQAAAEPVLPAAAVSPLAMASANAAMKGVLEALGEVGELAMRDARARALEDFRGGASNQVVISTTTLLVVIIVLLVLIIVF